MTKLPVGAFVIIIKMKLPVGAFVFEKNCRQPVVIDK